MVKLVLGVNDLKTWCENNERADLLNEWDYEANHPYKPQDFTHGSNKKVHWICLECGEKWSAIIKNRSKRESPRGCPACGARRRSSSFSKTSISKNGSFCDWCIKTGNTHLLDEWDGEKNLPHKPENISWGASHYLWWKCPCCAETYRSRLDHRRKGCGHKNCKVSSMHNSDAEVGILFYAQQAFGEENVFANYSAPTEGISEIDVFIPALKIGIEYDGEGYHSSRDSIDRDLRKDTACSSCGIVLYRIREPGCPPLNSSSICIERKKTGFNSDYDNVLQSVFKETGAKIDINSVRDQGEIIRLRGKKFYDNSLLAKFPDIASEWDYEKNAPLTPDMVSYGAERQVWWICQDCDYHYQTLIYSRTGSQKNGCPACKLHKIGQTRKKRVQKYSLEGRFIAEYDSLTEAANHENIQITNISACCNGKSHSSGGFIWKYSDDLKVVVPKLSDGVLLRYKQPIKQYSLDGTLIHEYNTIVEAEETTGVKAANIYRNAKGERKSASGFMWKFYDSMDIIDPYKTNSHNRRRVSQFSLDGKYIATHESVLAAEKATGINEASIRDACSGRNKTAGGYLWADAK